MLAHEGIGPAPALPIGTRRARRERIDRHRRRIAALVVVALVAAGFVAFGAPWATADEFRPTVTLTGANPAGGDDTTVRTSILAGEDATYLLSVSNDGAEPKYNTSVTALVPNGVSFVEADSLLGEPTVFPSGTELPDPAATGPAQVVPAGFQLWVWENVADLPAGALLQPAFTVRPDAELFPVGTTDLEISATAYTSSDETLLPSFPGSSSVATSSDHTSQPGTDEETTAVEAVRIHKSEPSPENELLRGVHTNTTTYTLRVQHTGQGATGNVTVVDHLPAGLEYLGNGGIDNTSDSGALFDGDREYPGAPSLTATPAPEGGGHLPEDSVETVALTDAEALELGLGEGAGGVYTRVTWTLPTLDDGSAQTWDQSPGEPGEFVIRYRVGVPLFENTLDFDGGAPTPASGGQAANLNNNNGPSTRHGQGEGYDDAISYVNLATVQGTYAGTVAEGADPTRGDVDTEVIDAVDLRIVKGVDATRFSVGELAHYSLDLATSEYTSAGQIEITDEIGNGICPALPSQAGDVELRLRSGGEETVVSSGDWHDALGGNAAACAYPSTEDGAELSGATLTGLLFDSDTGRFVLTLAVDDLGAQDTAQIVYTARQNEIYLDASDRHGPTSSGDSVANHVQIEAITTAIDAVEEVPGAGGTETVWEDSEAVVTSEYTQITKQVLDRDAGDPLSAAPAQWTDAAEIPFILGDDVWYRLTAEFPATIDTRNAVITDYLPRGVELREAAEIVYHVNGEADSSLITSVTESGNRLAWTLGVEDGGGDRFVPRGTVLEIYLPGTVVGLSASATAVDLPQNLLKYRQENSDGDVYFLRDDATIVLDHGMTLLKGVASVGGQHDREAVSQAGPDGTVFGSDRDGIEVVQGERVTYRIDVTAPAFATTDVVVWDVLPAGIEAADIDQGSFTVDGEPAAASAVAVYGPGDAGRPPVGGTFDGRTVIAWTLTGDIAADAELTLGYDLIVPAGDSALVTQEFDNLAGIASYEAVTNRPGPGGGNETVTYVPDGPFERPVGDGEHEVPGIGTSDDSQVYLPGPAIDKVFSASEIAPGGTTVTDPGNAANQIVQGEHATFTYEVTLPGHTTVRDGVLADDGVFAFGGNSLGYEVVSAVVAYPAAVADPAAAGFGFDAATGTLTFPSLYTTGEDDETFTVTLVVWVEDADASDPDHELDLAHGTALTNTARFTHLPATGGTVALTDDASVQYIEPDLSIAKTADPDEDVEVGSPVTYTIVVSNGAGRPVSYDNTVVDEVPVGLIVDVDSIVSGGGAWDAADRTITWQIAQVGAEPVELTYQASIDPATGGGQSYLNTVEVTGYTLPDALDPGNERRGDRADDDEVTITAIDADIAKGVRIAGSAPAGFGNTTAVPVGETVEYEVEVTLHPNINYWDPVIADTLPAGLEIIAASIEGPVPSDPGTIDGDWTFAVDGERLTWTYDGDITSSATERTLLLGYQVRVTDPEGGLAANSLPNVAEFTWNRVDGDEDTRSAVSDDATVILLHPALQIAKTVNGQASDTVDPGETFDYELVVTNTGTTAAYDLVVTDAVPAGVVVDADSISDGGVLTGADPDTGGGTITWDHSAAGGTALNGPLHQAGSGQEPLSIGLSYEARLAASEHVAGEDAFTNSARVAEWESFPDGGRGYGPSAPGMAVVEPAFPYVELTKEVTGDSDVAYAGSPFGWTLIATNTGDGPANLVELTDTLPYNWTFTEVTSVTVGGTPWTGDVQPVVTGTGADEDRQVLTWTFEGTPVLAPGASVRVAFLATPSQAALVSAGVTSPDGFAEPHVNILTARATDTSDAEGNADGSYSGDEETANAFLHAADLRLTKTAAGQPLVAGDAAATGWEIVVANDGPDTAVGPFTVSDTTGELPEEITVTGADGEGWTCAVPVRGADGITAFDCVRTDPAETLAAGGSFAPIVVTVQVDADLDPADLTDGEVRNAAVVASTGTHDPDPANNDDEEPLPVIAEADLTVEKVVNTAEPGAGRAITWQLNPANLGPSVSRSTMDQPITITDVVPEGISAVTVVPGSDWEASAPDGFPASAGEEIVFTYAGDVLPVGPAGTITLTGTISPSWSVGTELTNLAEIVPGLTPDPNPGNNSDDVTVTPGTETTLGISKTRVVPDGDGWQADTEAPVAGGPVSYLVTVVNAGTADALGVAVVDELPGYLSYLSHESVEGTWARTEGSADGDQHFTLTDPAALAPQGEASFVITAALDSAHTGDVVNWAEAGADNATNEPRDSDDSSSDRSANLSILKSHDGAAVAGETLDYTITVTNEGPSVSGGPITVTDELPAGFSYVSGTATVAVAGGPAQLVEPQTSGRELTWTVGDADVALAQGATIVITLTTAVAADVPAQTGLVNVAVVDGPDDDDPTDNTWPDPTNVVTEAQMSIVKDVEPGPWIAGTEVTYTFTVTNDGPSVADAVVTEVWPAGLTGVSISGEGWTCDGSTCEFDAHPVGQSTLTVTALIDQAATPGSTLTNVAELAWTDGRGSHEDDDPADVTVTTLADLGLVKTAVDADGDEVTQAAAGGIARFRIDVTNHGPSTAAAPITVVDTLPEGLTFVGLADTTHWSATAGEVTADGQEVSIVLGEGDLSLAAGATAPELVLIVQVDAGLPVTDPPQTPALVNVAEVSSATDEPDPDPNPNEDDAPLSIVHSADLGVVKTHAGTATIGEDLDFDIVVTNHGPSPAHDVTVTETLPAGLLYVGFDGGENDSWSQIGEPVADEEGVTTIEFALDGTVEPGDVAPALVLTATVTAAAHPEVTNVVVVDSSQPDPNPDNDRAEDPVPVSPDADLTLFKETLTETPHAGRELTWRITPTNLGPAPSVSTEADPVTITDTLPDGVSDVTVDAGSDWTAAASAGFPAQAGDTITLTYAGADAVPVGDTASVTLTGTIDTSFTGELTNLAEIHPGATPDRDPGNNDSSVTDPVDDATSIDVRKTTVDPVTGEATGQPVQVVPGTRLTYELTVTNTGSADARGIRLADRLPEGLTFVTFENVEPASWTSSSVPGSGEVELELAGALPAREGQNVAAVRLTVEVADDLALDTGTVTNLVTASAENAPEDPADEVTDPLTPSADLSITKSHTGATVAGTALQYTLLVENHGPSVSPGPITITDVLPEGLSYVPGSARVTTSQAEATAIEPGADDRELVWVIEDVVLAVGDTIAVTFQALVAPDVPATAAGQTPALVNTGEVDGPLDDDPENDTDDDPTTITELTDISIVKTVIGTGPFTAGTEVDYLLTLDVAGPSVARHVTLSDVVPEGLTLVSIGSEDDGWTWDQVTGVGTRDVLGLGEHVIPVTAVIDQAVGAGTTLVNTGVVEWIDSDGPKRADDPEDVDVIADADLGIVKTVLDAEGLPAENVTAGTELRYAFEVTNHGPSQAAALLEITDELPGGVTFLEVVGDAGGWAVVQDGQRLTFTHPLPLAAGETAPVLTIATWVAADVAPGTDLVNTAVVRSAGTEDTPGTPDGNPGNDQDDATVGVGRQVDLSVVKTHEGQARIGEELVFDLVVRNDGPSQATEVVLVDTLPAGLAYVSAAGEGWAVVAGDVAQDGTTTVTATLSGALAAGEEAPLLRLTVLVEAGAYPEVTNVADVTSAEPDADTGDNTDTDAVPVPAAADLGIVKTADAERLRVGETSRYTLTVTNHGPTEHVGEIVVTDALPPGLRAIAADGADCAITGDGSLVECTSTQSLAVGEELVISVEVEVLAGAWSPESAEVENTAVVGGSSEDPDPENNTSTVVTPVDPDVRLELEKTRSEVEGRTVHWTLTVSSVGLSDATGGVVIVDELPAELSYEGVISDAAVACEVHDGGRVECVLEDPIRSGESIDVTVVTTTSQADGTTVTNVAWLVDPVTGEVVPDSADDADHRVSTLPSTGVVVAALAGLALMLLLSGAVIRIRARIA